MICALLGAGALALVLAAPCAALACGGFYASEVEVDPSQTIVVGYRAGIESYTFRPHFCGAAKDFGVILPIPATLASQPTLGDSALYDQLTQYTAPKVEEVCESSHSAFGCGGSKLAVEAGGSVADAGAGVDVIDRGTVGNFDFVLLQATTASAFTDWLDANGFPHDASGTDTYQAYVTKGWYFVAFKVHADTVAPPAGKKLCGDLGPIALSFASPQPVVPARIAGVNPSAGTPPVWRLALIAAAQQRLAPGAPFTSQLYFSGALSASDLASDPALGAVAQAGERLTVLDVSFPGGGASDDISLGDDPQPGDFRTTQTVPKDCSGGCATGGGAVADGLFAAALLGLLGALRRAARQG